jgi:RimJ/RimL family protein N-acetyltransferase
MPALANPAAPEITSRDGARLVVRPMRRSDGGALAAAVESLSAETRRRRFLTPKPGLSRREVAALTDLDGHARVALVALDPDTLAWVAVARYAAFPADPRTADVALTVADAWQGRGVGTALFGMLVERARHEGMGRLVATTLAGNRPALRLLQRHGFAVAGWDGATVDLGRDLPGGGSRPVAA